MKSSSKSLTFKNFSSLPLYTVNDDIPTNGTNYPAKNSSTAKTRASAAAVQAKQRSINTAQIIARSKLIQNKPKPSDPSPAAQFHHLTTEEAMERRLAEINEALTFNATKPSKPVERHEARPTLLEAKTTSETSNFSAVPSLFELCVAALGNNFDQILSTEYRLPPNTLQLALECVQKRGFLLDSHIPLVYRAISTVNFYELAAEHLGLKEKIGELQRESEQRAAHALELHGQRKISPKGFLQFTQLMEFNRNFSLDSDKSHCLQAKHGGQNSSSPPSLMAILQNSAVSLDKYMENRAIMQKLGFKIRQINLIYLDFAHCELLNNENLVNLLQNSPNLMKLNLNGCALITSAAIQQIPQHCPRISILSLEILPKLTDLGIQSVLHDCPALASLNLGGNWQLSNVSYQFLADLGGNLVEFSAAGHQQLLDTDMRDLAKGCKKLRKLNVRSCKRLTDKGLNAIIELVKRQRDNYNINNNNNNSSEDKEEPNSYKGLRYLDLGGCMRFTSAAIINLLNASQDSLHYLDLRGLSLLKGTVLHSIAIKCANNLGYLNVSHCGDLSPTDIHVLQGRMSQLTIHHSLSV
jgi:hypothetical protein